MGLDLVYSGRVKDKSDRLFNTIWRSRYLQDLSLMRPLQCRSAGWLEAELVPGLNLGSGQWSCERHWCCLKYERRRFDLYPNTFVTNSLLMKILKLHSFLYKNFFIRTWGWEFPKFNWTGQQHTRGRGKVKSFYLWYCTISWKYCFLG